jgi:hypothetical protein
MYPHISLAHMRGRPSHLQSTARRGSRQDYLLQDVAAQCSLPMSCDAHTCLRSPALASLRVYGTQHNQFIGLPQRRLFPLQSTAHCDEAAYCFRSCMPWYDTRIRTPRLHKHHEFIGLARRNGFPQPSTPISPLEVILLHQDGSPFTFIFTQKLLVHFHGRLSSLSSGNYRCIAIEDDSYCNPR